MGAGKCISAGLPPIVAYIPPPPSELELYDGVGEVELPKEVRSPAVRAGLGLKRKVLERELCN